MDSIIKFFVFLVITSCQFESQNYLERTFYGNFNTHDLSIKNGNFIINIKSNYFLDFTLLHARIILFDSVVTANTCLEAFGIFENNRLVTLYTDKSQFIKHLKPSFIIPVNQYLSLPNNRIRNTNSLCSFKFELKFSDKTEKEFKLSDTTISGNSTIIGSCNEESVSDYKLFASLQKYKHFLKMANLYILITVLFNIIQVILMIRQINYSNTTARSSKLNFYTFMLIGMYDSFIIMIHVFISVTYQSLYEKFTIVVITQFIIFSVFDMKFAIMLVTTGIENEQINEIDEMRSRLGKLYLKFCVILIISTVILYADMVNYCAILFCSIWVPQIIHNVINGVNKMFRVEFIVGISFTKFFFFIYYYGSSESNLFNGQNNSNIVFLSCLFFYLLFQIVTLISMDIYGPRFMIPSYLQPKNYSYFRHVDNLDIEANTLNDCAICLEEVKSQNLKEVMITPCDHLFHTNCLMTWMEHQLKCPVCRSILPCLID